MGLFNNNKEELTKARTAHQLEKGRLKSEIESLKAKVEVLNDNIKGVREERDHYKGLDIDRIKVEQANKQLKIDREDLEDEKKYVESKLARLEKRTARLEQEENDEYKKGYSDGLADGLRKAHDITREDRKYLTMIAMSTNQGKAIEASQKAISDGFERDTESK